ncbi:MAG: hypothetical protein PHS79_04850 [Patescibacteria group bacterium]|nr:hypothetical protein [Patescibacteria group bacterium]
MTSKLKHSFQFLVSSFFFVFLFSVSIPWNKLPDPDAFYHATMAKLTWEQGAVTSFPWLDMTTLGTHFADQHFLLHVIQSPFVHFLGITQGSRISTLFIAVLCMFGITFIFYKMRLRPFWLWPILLALSNPFLSRMVLGKASPIAILLWLTGIAAYLTYIHRCALAPAPLPQKQERGSELAPFSCSVGERGWGIEGGIFLSSFLFTLTHGGWIILPGSIFILIIGNIFFNFAFDIQRSGHSVKRIFSIADIRPLIFSLLGVAAGILVHPGRNELLSLLWIQVVKIGIMTPSNLPMGIEWNPASFGFLLAATSVFGVVIVLIIPGLIFARKALDRCALTPNPSPTKAGEGLSDAPFSCSVGERGWGIEGFFRPIISLSLLVAVLVALTLKSARFAEYMQPALALLVAMLAQLVDWKKLFASLRFGEGKILRHLMTVVIAIAGLAVIANSVLNGYFFLHNRKTFYDDQFLAATLAISAEAQPGDRVYHAQWDEFPILFSRDQRLKYVAGLDPTFFYEATSTLALDYFNLTARAALTTKDEVWSLVHDRLDAKFAVIDEDRWPDLAKIFAQDKRYIKIGEGGGGIAYRVEDQP